MLNKCYVRKFLILALIKFFYCEKICLWSSEVKGHCLAHVKSPREEGAGTALTQVRKDWTWFFFFFLWGDQTKIPKFILKANNVAWGGSLTPLSFVILQREKHPLEVEKVTHEDVLFNEYDVREHLWHTLTPEPSLWANWTALLSKGCRILLWV